MSVTIQTTKTVEIPKDFPVAKFDVDEGLLYIYPAGLGMGPLIAMPLRDWTELKERAAAAISAAVNVGCASKVDGR